MIENLESMLKEVEENQVVQPEIWSVREEEMFPVVPNCNPLYPALKDVLPRIYVPFRLKVYGRMYYLNQTDTSIYMLREYDHPQYCQYFIDTLMYQHTIPGMQQLLLDMLFASEEEAMEKCASINQAYADTYKRLSANIVEMHNSLKEFMKENKIE